MENNVGIAPKQSLHRPSARKRRPQGSRRVHKRPLAVPSQYTDRSSVSNRHHIKTLNKRGIMIGTDCIYSCKSKYYAVTTVPWIKGRHDRHEIGPPITKEIMTNNLG